MSRFDGPEDINLVREDFHRAHEELFTFRDPDAEVQFVGWRATVRCRLSEKEIGRLMDSVSNKAKASYSRTAYFTQTGKVNTPVEMFGNMTAGVEIKGPAIIESPFTTIVIDPGAAAMRKESGSLVITA